MQKTIGKEYADATERRRYLEDNADSIENKGYMKPYTPEELQGHKENLANTMIEISAIESEYQTMKTQFKSRLKPLQEKRDEMVSNIRQKAEFVSENCYKFVDREERMTGYYNADGDLIEMRSSTADELGPNVFSLNRESKTGTDN